MKKSNISIQENMMRPLPLGSVKPRGWLRNQLQIQADGLGGHLDEFWPDIKDSGWFGGDADSWERAPYWLDGVIPLAFLLDDPTLIAKVTKYMDKIITRQDKTGWIAPSKTPTTYDLWAIFLVLKPLIQYYEVTGDERVPKVVEKILISVGNHIAKYPLFNWGKFRWFESLISIFWLYERTHKKWLIDLAVKIQSQGFDWEDFFEYFPLVESTPKGKWNWMGHVVNNAMAIKAPALWWRITNNDRDYRMVSEIIKKQEQYHGTVTGVFSGDECLAGKNPSQGTELCAVVEYMYSLEVLLATLGEPAFGDRLEKIAFNALPAAFSSDMWAHQYDQQVNQVECSVKENRIWTNNGPDANIYGLEPNYGCCTANFSQGWPKFTVHLWMRTNDGGLAVVAYAPCTVATTIEDTPIKIEVITEYPFREEIKMKVKLEKTLRFSLHLRIPAWSEKTFLQINEEPTVFPEAGKFYKIDKEWAETTELKMVFLMKPRAFRHYHNALVIERGPLVYSLSIGEEWKRINEDKPYREIPHADWEVYPTTSWNYALDLNEEMLEELKFIEHSIGKSPFSPGGAPISVKVKGIKIGNWGFDNGSAGEIPESPIRATEGLTELILIPYGCTHLRVTEFPTLK